ncbi:hypothetical protein F4782DRAFT_324674 [Xylaria castorea]|nr:hypothetical protein F4782DRAFT_324674 [Xylaria castorea]
MKDMMLLQTLLFGRIELWRDAVPDFIGGEPYANAQVLLSHSQEQYIAQLKGTPCQYDAMTEHNKSEWTEKLGELLASHLLSFGVHKDIDATNHSLPGTISTGITLLGIRKLNILSNGTQLTVGERCIMHVYIAVTLLHEITHAIMRARLMRPVAGEVLANPPYGFREPIVDCESISEIGEWFEQEVFGGVCYAHEIPIASCSTEMPSATRLTAWFAPGAWLNADATTKIYHIPTSWHSRILGEDFWKASGAPSKSRNFFHRPSVFVNETLSGDIINGKWEETQATYPDPQVDTYQEDFRIVQHWHNRHNIWKNLRAVWYDDEFIQWSLSPWYHLPSRWAIDTFTEAFTDRDEVGCAIIALQMADRVVWRWDLDTFNQYIPKVGVPQPGWVFHCIGLLMMASIPIREKGIDRKDRDLGHTVTLTPSRDMVAGGLKMDFQLRRAPATHKRGDRAEKSELFDHVNGRGQIEDGFSQMDYLTLVADVVARVTSSAIVHFSWVNAIKSAIQKLSKDRQELQAKYPDGHVDQWATDWAFTPPKYDKEMGYYDADGSACVLKFNAVSRIWE